MGRKVIFLDVDGVLNTYATRRFLVCSPGTLFVDTRKLLRLRDIIERTGAELVLSSTWRYGAEPNALYVEKYALRELIAEFKRVRCPLWADMTPIIPRSKREREIYAWLLQHPEVDNFVILDDVWEELEFYKDRLVLTNMYNGLTKERAELAMKMLGEKND